MDDAQTTIGELIVMYHDALVKALWVASRLKHSPFADDITAPDLAITIRTLGMIIGQAEQIDPELRHLRPMVGR